MRRVLGMLVLVFILLEPSAFSMGELTLFPSYYFDAQKFSFQRVGLFVFEDVGDRLAYTSWTGSGEVLQKGSSSDTVRWYTTQHDGVFSLNDRVKIGGGLGYSFSSPTSHSDVDVHARLSVQLW